MFDTRKLLASAGAASLAFLALTGTASAGGSLKDEPAPEGRQFSWSFNVGGTTDYIFRGISQSGQNPTFQAGIDASYGILYVGAWGSGLDFGTDALNRKIARWEVDYYAGIKPVVGPVTFDLGVIYYTYPGAQDDFILAQPAELDYFEVKLGASATFDKLSVGATLFYSPEYTAKQGEVWTLEGTVAYVLPAIGPATPTISALIGYQQGDFDLAQFLAGNPTYITANGDDSYLYWNVGISLAIDKLTLDFRYHDTNIKENGTVGAGFCTGGIFGCDERFVFTAKVTLP